MAAGAVCSEHPAVVVTDRAARYEQVSDNGRHREVELALTLDTLLRQADDPRGEIDFVPPQRRCLTPSEAGKQDQLVVIGGRAVRQRVVGGIKPLQIFEQDAAGSRRWSEPALA